jgi:predicted dehydrogenase
MNTLNVAIIGTGWCGGIRAVAAANHPIVADLHIAETNPERLAEMIAQTNPASAVDDWQVLVARDDIDAVVVSATPETTHYPRAKAALSAGKHVLLEKPIALRLDEADDLIETAEAANLKFTIGYSQRFSAKQALAKRSLANGTLGDPTSILVSRHIGRRLGAKIGNRIKLSPAAMEATHDIDFAMWCLEPRRPVHVYSQNSWGIRRDTVGLPDGQMTVITMDDGVVVTINAGMSLPNHYANAATTWIEVIGTDGSIFADDSHRDIVLNTVADGIQFPLSTMPGEAVGDMYAGPMERETIHFFESVVYDRPVMVEPRLARMTMELYLAADLSAELNEVVQLPLTAEQAGLALGASAVQ